MAGAPSGTRVLVQRATTNEFNVIVAPGSYADVDVSMKFKPMSGREDASGGIVFRFNDGTYYVHLDHHDSRFTAGRVGLWTKADSITAFDDLTVRGKPTGS